MSNQNFNYTAFEAEVCRSDIDRKTKKRVQNRVAQRTYRNRLKQRLEDLQQQVEQHEKRMADIQAKEHPGNKDSEANGTLTAANMNLSQYSFAAAENPPPPRSLNTMKSSVNGSQMWNPNQRYSADSAALTRSMMEMQPLSPKSPSASSGLASFSSGLMRYHVDPTNTKDGNMDYLGHGALPTPISLKADAGMNETMQYSDFFFKPSQPSQVDMEHCSLIGNGENLLPRTPPAPGTQGTQSRSSMSGPSTATSPPEQESMPHADATVEEKLEYILSCARNVGIDEFDKLFLHYYTTEFDQTSMLALDQRLSRNRHLPAIIANLRQQSNKWTDWEKRGVQDEMLKCAEDICLRELHECQNIPFRASPSEQGFISSEKDLQQMLPNLWALLTSLASSNKLLRQKQRSHAVTTSMSMLCGFSDATSNQTSSDSNCR